MHWRCIVNVRETKILEIECKNDGLRIVEALHLYNLSTYFMKEYDFACNFYFRNSKIIQILETLDIIKHV